MWQGEKRETAFREICGFFVRAQIKYFLFTEFHEDDLEQLSGQQKILSFTSHWKRALETIKDQ